MSRLLNEEERNVWNKEHQMQAVVVELRLDDKREYAEVWLDGTKHYPVPYQEALSYFQKP